MIMDFFNILDEVEFESGGQSFNPFAAQNTEGDWLEGTVSIDFLNEHFAGYETAEEMINATESEGLKLYFLWLRDENILN